MGRPKKYDDMLVTLLQDAGLIGISLNEVSESWASDIVLNARSLKMTAARMFRDGEVQRRYELVQGPGYIFRQYRYYLPEHAPPGAEKA